MDISQNTCSFYNNRWLDLSQFDLFYGGEDCSYYFLDTSNVADYNTKSVTQPLFSHVLEQSRVYRVTECNVLSLDIALGLIGGFVGLIWDLLGFFLGSYNEFKFRTALINQIYSTTEKSRMFQGQGRKFQRGSGRKFCIILDWGGS